MARWLRHGCGGECGGWGLGNDEKDLRHGHMGMVLGNTWLEVRGDLGVRLEGLLSSGGGGGTVGLMQVDVMRGLNMGVGEREGDLGVGEREGDTWLAVGDLGCGRV